jgi:hypothetical protein
MSLSLTHVLRMAGLPFNLRRESQYSSWTAMI